jgi:hypothetical protein
VIMDMGQPGRKVEIESGVQAAPNSILTPTGIEEGAEWGWQAQTSSYWTRISGRPFATREQ